MNLRGPSVRTDRAAPSLCAIEAALGERRGKECPGDLRSSTKLPFAEGDWAGSAIFRSDDMASQMRLSARGGDLMLMFRCGRVGASQSATTGGSGRRWPPQVGNLCEAEERTALKPHGVRSYWHVTEASITRKATPPIPTPSRDSTLSMLAKRVGGVSKRLVTAEPPAQAAAVRPRPPLHARQCGPPRRQHQLLASRAAGRRAAPQRPPGAPSRPPPFCRVYSVMMLQGGGVNIALDRPWLTQRGAAATAWGVISVALGPYLESLLLHSGCY